ncbi:unnamed protein product [Cochlearia groenlandica]
MSTFVTILLSSSRNYVSFSPVIRSGGSRLVVRAAKDSAPAASSLEDCSPATAVAPAETAATKAKPPQIGPKRGSQEPEDQLCPVVVRFAKVNYANISTNDYALDDVEEVKS